MHSSTSQTQPGIKLMTGQNSFEKAILSHSSGSTCEVYLYGAHITSWTKPGFGELLFMSKKAEFEKGKAIRGGVPVIFPQFGPGEPPMPTHGFARSRDWKNAPAIESKDGSVHLKLVLNESDQTLGFWPFKFQAEYEVILNEKLTIKLTVRNTDTKPFSFQHALHTYYKISNIKDVEVLNLKGLSYIDKVDSFKEKKEESAHLKFTSNFDSVYKQTPDSIELIDPGLKRKFIIEKKNMRDSVLWNPGEGGNSMKDMHENSYLEMICVESGDVAVKIEVPPGAAFEASQTVSVENL